MSFAKRVVLDTRTLISAALRPDSTPRQALLTAVANATLCTSPTTMAELERVRMRDKFDRYLDQSARREFLELYRRHARLFNVTAAEEAALPRPARLQIFGTGGLLRSGCAGVE